MSKKTSTVLCYIASVLFYIKAVMMKISDAGTSSAVIWMCLGSAFLCFGAFFTLQSGKKNSADE